MGETFYLALGLVTRFNNCSWPQEHSVVFSPQPEDKGTTIGQAHVAKQSQVSTGKSAVTSTAWHLKQSQKGLQPVRPVVVWTQDVTLEPGKALVLQT